MKRLWLIPLICLWASLALATPTPTVTATPTPLPPLTCNPTDNLVCNVNNLAPGPNYGGSAYPSQLYNYANAEQAGRDVEHGFNNFVYIGQNASACLGVPIAGLTMTPAACIGYNAGYRASDPNNGTIGFTSAITFSDNSSTWVAMDENTTGNNAAIPNFTRVANTHYLIDTLDATQPVMAVDTQLLMQVVTSGGAITAVTDLRTTSALAIVVPTPVPGGGGTSFPNASGSDNSYTCTIAAGSASLTCTGATDFLPKQGIAIMNAGTASPLTAFSAPSAVGIISAHSLVNGNQTTSATLNANTTSGFAASGSLLISGQVITYTGTTATTFTGSGGWTGTLSSGATIQQIPTSHAQICYEILAGDTVEGMTSVSSSTCYTYGPTTKPSPQFGYSIAWAGNSSLGATAGLYRSVNGGSYQFIAALGNTGSWMDFGTTDAPFNYDWPVTPAARNQTCYGIVQSAHGSAITLTAPCTNAAVSTLVRHDETVAFNAATATCHNQKLTVPPGTFHINQNTLWNGVMSPPYTYTFSASQLPYVPEGSVLIQQDGCQLIGSGRSTSKLVQDYDFSSTITGALFSIGPLFLNTSGGSFPQKASGAPQFTSYPVNNVKHDSYVVVTTTAGDASNFAVGDFAFVAGGAGTNGTYTAFAMSPVRAVNTSTGAITLADAIPFDIPYGSGQAAFIEDITTNADIIAHNSVKHMTIKTPNTVVSFGADYDLVFDDLDVPTISTNEFSYGNFAQKYTISNSDITGGNIAFEFPLVNYFTVKNNHFTDSYGPQSGFSFSAGAPLDFQDNTVGLGCGGSTFFDATITRAIVHHNTFAAQCPSGPSISDFPTVLLTTNSNLVGYSMAFTGNSINTNSSGGALHNNIGTRNMWDSGVFSDNNINWVADGVTYGVNGVVLSGSSSFVDNRVNMSGGFATSNDGAMLYLPVPGAKMGYILGNHFINTGAQQGLGISAFDGSSDSDLLPIVANAFKNFITCISIDTGSIPNPATQANTFDTCVANISPPSAGAPLSGGSLTIQAPCPFAFSPTNNTILAANCTIAQGANTLFPITTESGVFCVDPNGQDKCCYHINGGSSIAMESMQTGDCASGAGNMTNPGTVWIGLSGSNIEVLNNLPSGTNFNIEGKTF